MGPVWALARWIAGVLRIMARALEGGDHGLDAATAALAARFPGAPDHWLRYIAARAPLLAAAVEMQANEPAANDYRPASHGIRWWSRLRAHPNAPRQILLDNTDEPARLPEPPQQAAATDKTHPTTTRPNAAAKSRLWLRVVEPGKLAKTHTSNRLARTNAKLRPVRLRPLVLDDREPTKGARLSLVEDRPTTKQQRSAARDMPIEKSTPTARLELSEPPPRAPVEALALAPERARAPRTIERLDRAAMRRNAAPPAWIRSTPTRSPVPPNNGGNGARLNRKSPSPPRQSSPTEGPSVRRDAANLWPAEMSGDYWPELPQVELTEIDDAAVRPTDVERLRFEQDVGTWSG